MAASDSNDLRVPDPALLGSVEKLCSRPEPYEAGPDHEALFAEAMREITRWHAARSPFYRELLRMRGFSVESSPWQETPFIPANFFKANEVVSIPREQVQLVLTSSGTLGQKSQMFFDRWSIEAPQRMVDFIFARNGWITPGQKTNYLLYTYETEADSRLGTAFTDNYLCRYAPIQSVEFALKLTAGGKHEFDVFGCIRALERYEAEGLPVRIFGFPAFLHFTLKRMRERRHRPLRLHPDSLVFLGGGWKGHADQAISKKELYAAAQELLGIPDHRLRDGFGSVEHCIPYIECERHNFHVPIWSRVLIRDPRTLELQQEGVPGLLQLVSPYITSVPAQSVLMGDLASLYGPGHGPGACGCSVPTAHFVVHGRAGVSRNKSCAAAAAELLREK